MFLNFSLPQTPQFLKQILLRSFSFKWNASRAFTLFIYLIKDLRQEGEIQRQRQRERGLSAFNLISQIKVQFIVI